MEVVPLPERAPGFPQPHPAASALSPALVDAAPLSLESLYATFASELTQALRTPISTNLDISPLPLESLDYGQFIASRPSPTCIAILKVDPPGAQVCLELSPGIAYPMIGRLLGGFGESAHAMPQRSFTQIEQGLALQIIERAAAVLADTWSRACPLTVREDGLFNDPAHVRIMPGDELVSVATFHIAFDGHAGRMSLCVPAPVTDLLRGSAFAELAPTLSANSAEPDAQHLMDQAVELRAILAQTKLRLSEVLALQEGDLITTDIPADSDIPLRLNNQTIRSGRVAQLNGHKVLEISDPPPGGTLPS